MVEAMLDGNLCSPGHFCHTMRIQMSEALRSQKLLNWIDENSAQHVK